MKDWLYEYVGWPYTKASLRKRQKKSKWFCRIKERCGWHGTFGGAYVSSRLCRQEVASRDLTRSMLRTSYISGSLDIGDTDYEVGLASAARWRHR